MYTESLFNLVVGLVTMSWPINLLAPMLSDMFANLVQILCKFSPICAPIIPLIDQYIQFRLSAFVLKSYAQARPWIDVDDKELKMTSNWLIRSQNSMGCFPKIGHLHHKAMKGGVKTPATLTAYVLISLLDAGWKFNSGTIKNATKCVVFSNDTDSYSLSIMAYLFAKLKDNERYGTVMKFLDEKAINVGKYLNIQLMYGHWSMIWMYQHMLSKS